MKSAARMSEGIERMKEAHQAYILAKGCTAIVIITSLELCVDNASCWRRSHILTSPGMLLLTTENEWIGNKEKSNLFDESMRSRFIISIM
jgi:hypothetical protein